MILFFLAMVLVFVFMARIVLKIMTVFGCMILYVIWI